MKRTWKDFEYGRTAERSVKKFTRQVLRPPNKKREVPGIAVLGDNGDRLKNEHP